MTTTYGGVKTETVTLTAAAATAPVIDKRGLTSGSISNESGGAVTITWYARTTVNGTSLAMTVWADDSALTQTIGDDEVQDMPPALAGVPFIVPVAGSGTPALTFHFEH